MNKEFVSVRLLKKDDLSQLVKFRNDKKIWLSTKRQGNFNKKKVTIKDENEWFKRVSTDKKRLNLAINLNEKYIGNIYFSNITKTKAEFEIFIGDKSLWGRGIGFKSTKIAIHLFLSNYNVREIYLTVRKDNIPAQKLYAKCGFKLDKQYSKNDIYFMRYTVNN